MKKVICIGILCHSPPKIYRPNFLEFKVSTFLESHGRLRLLKNNPVGQELMSQAPKKENENVGFRYHVTMEQIREHQKKTPEEILEWIEEYARFRFLHAFQTPEDKERMRILKNKKTTWD